MEITNKPRAILSFDVEFWHNGKFMDISEPLEPVKFPLSEMIQKILNLLEQKGQKATFFVLGQLAEQYPDIIKKISNNGHEIASHGYSHKILDELGENIFNQEIHLTNTVLQGIVNKPIKGFRAPNFSLTPKTSWALKTLAENKFQYDSSTHPLKSYKFNDFNNQIREVPASLGGIYFRILPLGFYCFLIKHFSKNNIPVLYFHPHELFGFAPQIKSGPWLKRKIKYWGVKSAKKKFTKLLDRFQFMPLEQYLYENSTH